MLEDVSNVNILNIVYATIALFSFVFAVISLVGIEFGDSLDVDIDADADSAGFITLSPFVLSMFGAAFGITGLITRLWLDMDPIPSILWSTGIGLAVGAVAQAAFFYIFSPTRSSHYSLRADAKGREAEVIITIPENGLGTIAFDNVSGRVTLGARSAEGQAIERGSFVTIERITGRVAVVRLTDNN